MKLKWREVIVVVVMMSGVALRVADASSSVGAAPRRSMYKSGTAATGSTEADVTAVTTRQEGLLRMLHEGAADTPEETMRQFNEWGPYRSSYVVVSNMRGLPGRYEIYIYIYTHTHRDREREREILDI